MKKLNFLWILVVAASFLFTACEKDEEPTYQLEQVPDDVLAKLEAAGFNIYDQPPIKFDEGYIVEGDIFVSNKQVNTLNDPENHAIDEKQYSTDNLVTTNGPRTITVFASQGGFGGFNTATIAGIDLAIERYNEEQLELNFVRVNSSNGADITISRLNFFLEFFGVLGSAGFPTANGDPFDEIDLNGRLSNLGFDTEGIATIVAHEMGHCIGFRHTDFFDRSISCGGTPTDEGDGGVGANQIDGTPAGASLQDPSWMLACSDGSDRPFTNSDVTALNVLYGQ